MKSFIKNWLMPIIIAVLLVGCANKEETVKEMDDKGLENEAYTVVDDRGVEVTFDQVPNTIVSLQPSNTEILFELGVGNQIIGATDYDTYPEEALKIERVSDTQTINIERILELNPDVVFAYWTGEKEKIEQLEASGLNVFVINPPATIEDVYRDIELIAQVMHVEEKGNDVISGIQTEIEEVKEKTATIETKRKVYFEIAPAPDIWSIGAGTFQQHLIESAGVENIYNDQQGWFAVSEEDLIMRNPEVIVTTVIYTDDPKGEILNRQGWESISAIQNKEVYVLDANVIDRPGPRIGEAIELIASTIYPEVFQ